MIMACDAVAETEYTTEDFTDAEKAAWRVAVDRGLSITAIDLHRMIEVAIAVHDYTQMGVN